MTAPAVATTCTNCTGTLVDDTRTEDAVLVCELCRLRYTPDGQEISECGYHWPDLPCRLPTCPHCVSNEAPR